jgi:hypothetical protein
MEKKITEKINDIQETPFLPFSAILFNDVSLDFAFRGCFGIGGSLEHPGHLALSSQSQNTLPDLIINTRKLRCAHLGLYKVLELGRRCFQFLCE